MSRRHTYTTTLNWGGDTPTAEVEVTVSYLVCWGTPEQGPSYASGGQPADPDEIDDIRLDLVEGKPRPWNIAWGYVTDDDFALDCVEKIEGSDHHMEAMLIEAAEADAGDAADAAERRAEDRREWAREDWS